MTGVATMLVLSLAAAAPEPIRIAVNELTLVNQDPKLSSFYTQHLAQQLSFQGVKTLTSTEMAAVLGLERQRQLAGCPDDSCRADVASALGVDGLLIGSVTKLDRSYQLDVKIVAAGDGRPLAVASSSSDDNDRLVGTFVVVAEQLAKQVSTMLGRPLTPGASVEVVQGASRIKRLSWIPAAAGVGSAVVGGVFLGLSRGKYDLLVKPQAQPLTREQYDGAVSAGKSQQTVGWALVGVSAALVVGAAGMFLFGGNETVRAGVALAPGGAGISFSGVLP
ncbi:MAG: hypothetical protein K1X89_07160 [Myxococcaceae bacterium]|nr:hypothetical protein [Myxococcaceae bacterium]